MFRITGRIYPVDSILALCEVGPRARFFIACSLVYPEHKLSIEKKIEQILIDPLQRMGYGIVRIRLSGIEHKTLEIMVEREDDQPIVVADCVKVSREASALLDVADPLESAYVLEVTSPGIERPLATKHDFERFAGREAKIKTHEAIDDRRRFQGILRGVKDESVVIAVEDEQQHIFEAEILLDNIQKAKLVAKI